MLRVVIDNRYTPDILMKWRLIRVHGTALAYRIFAIRDARASKRLPLPGMVWQRISPRGLHSWPNIRMRAVR